MSTRRIRLDLTRSRASLVMLANLFFFCSYAQAGQVTLAWNASTSPGVAGYEINYGQTRDSYASQVDVGNQTSYTLTGLLDGATYYFAAKAYDSGKATFSGFSNEVSATTPVSPPPTAGFAANPTSGTAPLTVTFTDASTGNITTWSWSFGDGTTGTAQNAAKAYTNPGTYPVALTVTGPGGSNTATRTVSVTAAAPVADFTATTPVSGTAPLAVAFTNGSTGTVSGYSWSFGDGGTSTAQHPAHTYTAAGTYTVSLTATGPGGTSPPKTRSGYITVSSTGGGSNTGLVGAYNFEEASGTTVVDASGKANTGTISGATRTTQGRFGKALSFDGVNDWVTINDSASLALTSGMTLEAWVYPTVNMSQWATVVWKGRPDGGLYELYANGESQPLTAVTVGGQWKALSGGPWLLANQWTHLAATYDGTTQRLYVNGTQVAQRPQTGPINVSSSPLRLGGNSVWGGFFKGRIDEVRVYNRALSAAAINADLNTAIATSAPPVSLIGNQAVGSVSDSNPQGKGQAFQAQANVTGWVTTLSVYVDTRSTATTLVAGIYSDNNGHPGSRLALGTLVSPGSGGWRQVALPPVKITAGTKYWIAILSPNGVLKFRDGGGFTGGLSEASAQTTLTTLPSTWTSGPQVLEGPLSAYGAGSP